MSTTTDDPRTRGTRPDHQMPIGRTPAPGASCWRRRCGSACGGSSLSSPVHDLAGGHHTARHPSPAASAWPPSSGSIWTLVFRNMGRPFAPRTVLALLAVLAVLAPVLAFTLGSAWLRPLRLPLGGLRGDPARSGRRTGPSRRRPR
ncbi:hypothetical protein LT493_08115 [Streptomyces tricolor]|nr:hypothetical protein [Streptomyces tricolor]